MSVQWNPRNYAGVNTQEIAAWDEDDTVWWDFEAGKPVSPSSSVLGWVTSKKLGEYMDDIASITMSSTELQLVSRLSPEEAGKYAFNCLIDLINGRLVEEGSNFIIGGKFS
jgi:hypothetical protein